MDLILPLQQQQGTQRASEKVEQRWEQRSGGRREEREGRVRKV
jgi:hypothetical protein